MKDTIIGWLVVLVLVSAIGWIFYFSMTAEISNGEYHYVNELSLTNRHIIPRIKECLKDGIITRPEYKSIISDSSKKLLTENMKELDN